MKEIPASSALIIGYGREGQSAHKYLHTHLPEVSVGIADQKPVSPLFENNVHLYCGGEYLDSIHKYQVIIRSAGIPSHLPEVEKAREEGRWITSVTNIFFSEAPGMVIGITGTKGKSTTASLTAEILSRHFPDVRLVGNIGKPALDYLDGATKETIFIMELSSHQLEDSRYSPHIAVVLDIMPEHLDYYSTFAQYISAKSQIVTHQKKNDFVVFNPRHKYVGQFCEQAASKKIRFGLSPQPNLLSWIDDDTLYTRTRSETPQAIISTTDIPLLGSGNKENVLASLCVAKILNVPTVRIKSAIEEFKPLEHRMEFVGEFRGIRFYNDSLATIPQATIHAIEALAPNVTTLIAGGYDRGLDFTALARFLSQSSVKNLILFPDTGPIIEQLLQQKKQKIDKHIVNVDTMREAVANAFKLTKPTEICLMSPAAASFNLFRDYADRGNQFKEYVEALGGN